MTATVVMVSHLCIHSVISCPFSLCSLVSFIYFYAPLSASRMFHAPYIVSSGKGEDQVILAGG